MFLEQTINGLAVGSVYALVAVGYSLIFGVLRILNLAHASFYAFTGNIMLVLIGLHFGIVPALIVAIILTGLLASLFNAGLLAPLREKQVPNIIHMITAIGFSYVIDNLLIAFLGSDRKSFPNIFPTKIFQIGGAKIQSSPIVMLAVSLILLLVLSLIVNHTKLGLGMRASEQNPKAANLMGINVKRTITITFFLSGVYAALAGFLISGYYQMAYPTMGVMVGTKAFVSAGGGRPAHRPCRVLYRHASGRQRQGCGFFRYTDPGSSGSSERPVRQEAGYKNLRRGCHGKHKE